MLRREALMLAGPIPSLYPKGTQCKTSSIFGMVGVKHGSHVTISEETERCPNFARLITMWAACFSEECFGSIMAFTSIEVKKTQDAQFSALDGKMGTVMIVDVDDTPNGKFYVKDMLDDSPIRSHNAWNGPLLLQTGRHEYMPAAYIDEKTIVVFYIAENYQSCPRSTLRGTV